MGPSAIRYAGLDARIADLGRQVEDWGNVVTPVAESIAYGDEHARFLEEIKATCADIADLVARAKAGGYLPLVLGGDHSVALGTLGGLARSAGPGGVDRRARDLNCQTGRPATCTAWCSPPRSARRAAFERAWTPSVDPLRVALVGVRSPDQPERDHHRSSARITR
jgi:arginase